MASMLDKWEICSYMIIPSLPLRLSKNLYHNKHWVCHKHHKHIYGIRLGCRHGNSLCWGKHCVYNQTSNPPLPIYISLQNPKGPRLTLDYGWFQQRGGWVVDATPLRQFQTGFWNNPSFRVLDTWWQKEQTLFFS